MYDDKSLSVSIRKIENGYVKTTTTCGEDGYSSKEEFSSKEPSLGGGAKGEAAPRGNSLRDAVKVLNRIPG